MIHSTPLILFLVVISSINNCYSGQLELEPRIVNGFNITSMRGFEYQVSLRIRFLDQESFGNGHFCGGSLIDYDIVLTAAHCVHDGENYLNASLFSVVMGNLNRTFKDNNTLVLNISKIIGHENYNPDTFENDIAWLRLSENVPSDHATIKPIELSTISPEIGKSCQISGWGTQKYEENDDVDPTYLPNILMGGNVVINSKFDCNKFENHNGEVFDGMFCAGDFDGPNITDSCKGDSGKKMNY